ncbi:MAG: hypothetical protein OEQ74_03800 [Gammaproteobacteria bacterium]|nr:hypothetical protein [Gammaproteobacteria bacterium]
MPLVPLFVVALLWAGNCFAEKLQLDMVETNELRLIYASPFQDHLVPHIVRNYHNSLAFHKKAFGWTPSEEVTILLTDLSDYGNAGAVGSPYNGVTVYTAPSSRTLETLPGSEVIFMLMNHELAHVAHMDVADSRDLAWRRFFGGKPRQTSEHPESILYNFLTVPRLSAPRWYFEGAAVFMETWMAGGVGRAQGAYDEMVFRGMVRDDARFYSALGIVSEGVAVDFQTGTNAYLYGTRFISYVSLTYSPELVLEWLSRNEGSERYYAEQFKQVFGKPLDSVWADWIAWEREWQAGNLQAVREYPLTEKTSLTDRALGSISRSYFDPDTNTMIGAFRYPGVVAHVGVLSLDEGTVRRVTDIKGPMKYRVTSTAWDEDSRTLFYTADNLAYRDLVAVNVDTSRKKMLIKDGRIGDLAFNKADKSIWGLRHLNGYVSLVRIPPPYTDWNLVHAWPYGEVAYEMDISTDGKLLSTSMGEIDGKQKLHIYETAELLEGRAEPKRQFDFGIAVPEGFVFSPDGRYLFGSSFYTGVSNIFRYDIATGEIEAVSNAETGFFRPIPLDDSSLIVFEYTGKGFQPQRIDPQPLEDVSAIRFLGAEIAARHPVVRDWNVIQGLRAVEYEGLVTNKSKYQPAKELKYDSGYPVIEGYKDSEALGWHFQFRDPAQFNRVEITTSYSWDNELPSSEKLHFNAEYHGLNWYTRYWHNDSDFYDLFGPTKRSRKGDAFITGYGKTLIYDEPRELRFSSQLAYYTGLDTLPNNQNVQTFFFDKILSFYSGLYYQDTRKSLGSVDHEKGVRWNLELGVNHSEFDTFFKPNAGLDFGFALPWKHSSVWFYNSAGTANGNILDPLANYYFGGFGNNYVDDGGVKRYRDYNSFPGFEIDEIAGQRFVKTVGEWNLPPLRFRRAGAPSFFLSHLRPAIFFGALTTDPGKPFERTVTSAGFQLDLKFTVAHRLPMTLSVGYAAGFENGDEHDNEWLLSLKIM